MVAALSPLIRLGVLALLVIAMPVSVLLEFAGDCDFALEGAGSRDSMCLHGHDDSQDEHPGRCPTDHHSAARCGCSCHYSSMIPIDGARVAPLPAGFLMHQLCVRLLERRDALPLRPPIGV